MIALIALAVSALSAWQIVEILHHGSLFKEHRKTWRKWAEDKESKYKRLLGELLTCPFCMSVWAAGISVVFWLSSVLLLQLLVFVLAATRLAQLGNDLFYDFNRSPRDDIGESREPNDSEQA